MMKVEAVLNCFNLFKILLFKAFGQSPHLAARSCKEIKTAEKHAKSGLYWLNFDRSMHAEKAFQVSELYILQRN